MTVLESASQPPQSPMLTPTLLLTKTAIPQVPSALVPRPRLTARLDQSLSRRLTLLVAPAGYGKTMLLSQWVAQRGIRAAWVALDEGDNDLNRFWAYVIAALQSVHATIGVDATMLLRAPQAAAIETIIASLINDLALVTEEMVLALDDYHVITAPAVHSSLASLLDHIPSHLHVALTSRADPPLPLSRMRVRGQMLELRAADLRFTQDEAAVFLREVMGLPLVDQQVAALEARTEGWIASLHLAALSLQNRADVDQFVAQFTGSHRYVVDYLADEVLQRQPESVQRFLLDTAILDQLTAPLCDAVSERMDSQAVLETLERQVLVIPLDEERHWYRYHNLFATFLRHHLQQHAAARVPELHRRASAWYAAQGQISEAVAHTLVAQDWNGAAALLTQVADDMFLRGEVTTLQRWLDVLPAPLFATWPQLAIAKAWTLVLTNDLAAVEPHLHIVEQAITASKYHEEAPAQHDIPALHGQVAAVRGFVALRHNDLERASSLLQQALECVPDTLALLRGLVADTLVRVQRARGDVQAVRQALDAVQKIGESTNDSDAWLVQVGMLMEQGHLRDAAQLYRRIMQRVREHAPGAALPIGLETALFGLSDILYEWNDLDGAIHLLLPIVEQSTQHGEIGTHLASAMRLARATLARGDDMAAHGWLQQAATLMDEHNLGASAARMQAVQVRLALRMGDSALAGRWAQQSDLPLAHPVFPYHDMEYLTLVRVWIAQGKVTQARDLLERCRHAIAADDQPRAMIEILVLQARVLQTRGDTPMALATLQRAVTLAEPEGYIRVFVDEDAPIQMLLVDLRRAHPLDDQPISAYLDELLAAFGVTPEPQQEGSPQSSNQQLIEPLTERELGVLACMAHGLGNAEIADELVVAVSTVRTHIKNIYGKLAVRNRVEAVTRAQELGLVQA